MTYKLDLEEQETSTNLGDSCVYNIVDGDELRIEPVNTLSDTNKIIETASNNGNDRTFTVVSINCDNQTSEVITSKLNEKLNDYQNSNTNDVSLEISRIFFFLPPLKCVCYRTRKMLHLISNEVQIKLY